MPCGRTSRRCFGRAGCRSSPSTGTARVGEFDLLGVSFSTELGYTNLLTALDLAGIPLHAASRTDGHPLVIAGGHAAFNPEPIADFVDAVVLGDGEQAVLALTDLVADWKAQGQPGGRAELLLRLARSGLAYVPSCYEVDYHPDGRIRRVAPASRPHRHTVAGRQAHRQRPGLLALPQGTARAVGRVGARADVGRDLPRLHSGLPVLPGRDDHPSGSRALDHRDRRDGRTRAGRNGFRGGRAAEPLLGRPLGDRRDHQGPGRPLRRHPGRAVAAVHARRCLQHRSRERADPRRPAVRADLRPGRRVGTDPQGHQQDGERAGPHRHRRSGIRRRVAPGEALLHVWAADRDRRGRAADRGAGQEGHRHRSRGQRPA